MNHVDESGGIRIGMSRADDIVGAQNKPIALAKVDVEGYELPILWGARSVLGRTRTVYLAWWARHLSACGYGTPEVLDFLRRRGFVIYRRGREGWEPVPAIHVSKRCENLSAVRAPAVPPVAVNR